MAASPEQMVQQMEVVLAQLLDPVTLEEATKSLKVVLKDPNNLIVVATCIEQSQNQSVRQMGCSVLKEKIKKSWTRIANDRKVAIKALLLRTVLAEPVKTVRSGVSNVISLIAKHELSNGQWPEFMEWLGQCVQSHVSAHREVGMQVLETICLGIPKLLHSMLPSLFQLFTACFNDSESLVVPYYAVRCITHLLAELEPQEVVLVQPLLDPVVLTIRQLLGTDEEKAIEAFDFFDGLFEAENVMACVPDISNMVQLFLEVASERKFQDKTRTGALAYIVWTIQNAKKFILKNKLIQPILQVIFPIMAEPKSEGSGDLLDDEDGNPCEYAAHVLDSLALNLAPSVIIQPVLEIINQCIESADARQRLTVQIALRTVAEGCSDYLRPQLENVLRYVNVGLEDPVVENKEAACLTVIQFARHLQPEICTYHAEVLPRVFSLMSNSSNDLQEKSCVALESFCLNLGEDLKPYLQTIMHQFVNMLQNSERSIQEVVVYGIGSTAVAAGIDFLPFLDLVYNDLKTMMCLTGEENATLRANATDAMGAIIRSLGKENVALFVEDIFPLALNNLSLEDPEIDQCTFGLFGSLAAVYQEEFASHLETILPHIYRVLENNDATIFRHDEGAVDLEDSDAEDDDDDQWEEADDLVYQVNTDHFLAKETGLNVMGSFAEHLPVAFSPYIGGSLDTIFELSKHPMCPDIQKAALSTLCQYLECIHDLTFHVDRSVQPAVPTWTAGMPVAEPLPVDLKTLGDRVMGTLLPILTTNTDVHVVGAIFNVIIDPLRKIGPGLIEANLDAWLQVLYSIICGKAACQSFDLDNDDADNKLTVGEYDSLLIDGACELISETSRLLGKSFAQYFPLFKDALLPFFTKDSSDTERSSCIGTMVEITNSLQSEVTPWAPEILELLNLGVHDEEADIRISAAYGLGLLCQYCGPSMHPQYNGILGLLSPMFSDDAIPNIADNAAAAVAKMIMAAPQLVPLEQVLPTFVNALPLKKDYTENVAIYECLYKLFQSQNAEILKFTPQIIFVLAHVIEHRETELKTGNSNEMASLLSRSLYAQNPGAWAQVLQQKPELEQLLK